MSYRIEEETGDIVIDGWEQGIAPSPHKGIANIQCSDISTIPGEVMANYGRVRQSQTLVVTSNQLNASDSTHLSYGSSNAKDGLQRGTWIHTTSSSISNLVNNTDYYIKSSVGGSIQVATTFEGTTVGSLGVTGTATFTIYGMGKPLKWWWETQENFPNGVYFVLDSGGYVWQFRSDIGSWRMIAHNIADTLPNHGAGSTIFAYGNILVGCSDQMYTKGTVSDAALGTAWAAFTVPATFGVAVFGINTPQNALLGNDQVVYITNNNVIASLTVIAGADPTTFDPTTAATYTFNASALTLPQTQVATCLAELNTNLLIGTQSANLYSWNRTPISIGGGNTLNSFFFPQFLPERYTWTLVTVNNLCYVFCGSKGNIYVTNGTTISPVIHIPDYVTGQVEPYYVWGGTMYVRGRIWFSVQDSNSQTGGVWSFIPQQNYFIEQDAGASLRLEAQNTYGTYAGMATLLFPALGYTGQQARGVQYWAAWDDGTSGGSSNPYGIDFSDTNPFTGSQAIVETDIIPTGTMLSESTFSQIEYKLATPLASVTTTAAIPSGATSATLSSVWGGSTGTNVITFSDNSQKTAVVTNGSTAITWTGGLTNAVSNTLLTESVTIKWRTNATSAYATTGSEILMNPPNTAGYFVPDFEFTQWIQLQVTLQSTTNSPSFVRLKEIRIRQ